MPGFPNFDGESSGGISASPYTEEENKNAGDPMGNKSSRYLAESHFHVAFGVRTTPPLKGTLRKT